MTVLIVLAYKRKGHESSFTSHVWEHKHQQNRIVSIPVFFFEIVSEQKT